MVEALRLADLLETNIWAGKCGAAERKQAAAELRRLSAENDLLGSAADKLRVAWRDEVHCLMQDKRQLTAQRDALLEALCALVLNIDAGGASLDAMRTARAAIKAVEEGK